MVKKGVSEYRNPDSLLKPGSKEAIKCGCICPVMDNHHGRGFPYGGSLCFWHSVDCPIHGEDNGKTGKNVDASGDKEGS